MQWARKKQEGGNQENENPKHTNLRASAFAGPVFPARILDATFGLLVP
jgi:hypothetical protein